MHEAAKPRDSGRSGLRFRLARLVGGLSASIIATLLLSKFGFQDADLVLIVGELLRCAMRSATVIAICDAYEGSQAGRATSEQRTYKHHWPYPPTP